MLVFKGRCKCSISFVKNKLNGKCFKMHGSFSCLICKSTLPRTFPEKYIREIHMYLCSLNCVQTVRNYSIYINKVYQREKKKTKIVLTIKL